MMGSMTTTVTDPLASARTQLQMAFERAAGSREDRQAFDPVTGELGWVLHERAVMHGTVNRIREGRGLAPVPVSDIEKVERSALGHSDYGHKFVLRCAELTV